MKEKDAFEEAEKRIRILEIGSGTMPATEQGGTLFQQKNVDYIGIEVRNHRNGKRKDVLYANAAQMPFADDSFDYILMRSIFGQFTGFFPVSHQDDIQKWGMDESFRVLKPGGRIVISEENTPWSKDKVIESLSEAGFSIESLAKSEKRYADTSEDDLYRKLRDPFFKTTPTNDGLDHWGSPYILIAKKPLDPVYEIVAAEIRQQKKIGDPYLFADVPDGVAGRNPELYTVYKGDSCSDKKHSLLIAEKTYKKGKRL